MILCFHILEDRRRDSEIERELYRARLEELDNAIAELLETRPTTTADTSLRRTESERDPSSTTSMYSHVIENNRAKHDLNNMKHDITFPSGKSLI